MAATYLELYSLRDDSGLMTRVTAAMMIVANSIYDEVTVSQPRIDWANLVYERPDTQAPKMLWMLIAMNDDKEKQAIIDSTDVGILANVNAAVDKKFGAAQ